MSSSKFATPFFQKSPLYGAYSQGAGGMVKVSYADVHSKFQNDIAKNVAKHYAKDNDPCSDPNTVQYTKDSVLKKCPKKTSTPTASPTSEFTMPADLEAIANKTTKSETNAKTSFPSTYDFLTALGKGVQDKAVNDIKNVLDPNKNNQIQ